MTIKSTNVAYYNEIDPFAAKWLRNLIKAGAIAPGDVDERSIEDVHPSDLKQYRQCHFFAGIGVWSHALRLAGWKDDRQVWTASCPCQPFSAAGKGIGFADERHLWPALYHLIEQCKPPVVFGEQVASRDGLEWLDLVQADLEASNYATAAFDLCAAGFGAPHIRQRLYWVADTNNSKRPQFSNDKRQALEQRSTDGGYPSRLGNTVRPGLQGAVNNIPCTQQPIEPKPGFEQSVSRMADAKQHIFACQTEPTDHIRAQVNRPSDWAGRCGGAFGGLDNPFSNGWGARRDNDAKNDRKQLDAACDTHRPNATNGHWRDADWLGCRDGKWRPVEPGTFPLANGASSRVGRLRAYGNAIIPQVAQNFIRAYLGDTIDEQL